MDPMDIIYNVITPLEAFGNAIPMSSPWDGLVWDVPYALALLKGFLEGLKMLGILAIYIWLKGIFFSASIENALYRLVPLRREEIQLLSYGL